MAEGGEYFGYKDDKIDYALDNDDDYTYDDDYDQQIVNRTQSFHLGAASTPYNVVESAEMKTFMHEKDGLPSYDEKTPLLYPDFEDLTKRFHDLKKVTNTNTGLFDIRDIPDNFIPNEEIKQEQIRRFKKFLKARFPNNEIDKYPTTFSKKTPMELVVLGPKGGGNTNTFIRWK